MKSFTKKFQIKKNSNLQLKKFDPSEHGAFKNQAEAAADMEQTINRLRELQAKLYATKTHSLLIVLQGLDAAGKDGVLAHVLSGLNPAGTKVAAFKNPSSVEAAHDFLWRVHPHAPAKGEIAIFNRSHYEDVLVVRVHHLAPKKVWKGRYEAIQAFEHLLGEQNQTTVLKFFLHISQEEQLARFKVRLDEPDREWKISNSDYSERELWDAYTEAFEEAISKTSTDEAPWFVIPANHKWFRDLAISKILVETLEKMELSNPPVGVDLKKIKKEFQQAESEEPKEKRKIIEKLVVKKEKKLAAKTSKENPPSKD